MSRRALLVQGRHPTPDQDAGSGLTVDVAEALVAMGFHVTLCAVAPEEGWRRYARLLEQSGIEVRNGIDAVTDDLRSGAFEVAVMTFWPTAEVVAPIVAELAPKTAIIVHSGDLHFLRMARRAAVAGAPIGAETGRDFSRELNAYLCADRVIMVSEEEAVLATYLLGDGRRFSVVPLSEPVAPPPLPLHERSGLLFVGNFRHIPNLEAVLYLCEVVLPHIDSRLLEKHPLTVVGNGLQQPWYCEVNAAVRRLHGVRVPGWVPDVQPYVRRARLSVVPLLHGAGVKGKILTSLAAGTPVLTTPVGVEGLAPDAAAAATVVDGAFEQALAIEHLLTDDAHWAATAARGPSAVARVHARDIVLQRLRRVIEDAIDCARLGRGRTGASRTLVLGPHQDALRHDGTVVEHLAEAVLGATSPADEVLVLGGGDDVRDIPGRMTRRFATSGEGEAVVPRLRALIDRGARCLVVPAPSLSLLHRFPELAAFLDDGGVCLLRSELGRVYRLPPIAPDRGRIVAAVNDTIAAQLAAFPPVTCQVEARLWSGSGPPPLADAMAADLVVAVRPGVELPGGFWDRLAASAQDLRFDVLQPAFAIGAGGPPAYEAQTGLVARAMPVLVGAPVLAARADGAIWLSSILGSAEPPSAPHDAPATAVLDALPVNITPDAAGQLRDAMATSVQLRGIVSRGRGRQSVPERDLRPDISVVIATYRRPQLLAQCLDSFAAQDAPPGSFEVVVVDDGSGDAETFDVIDRYRDKLPITALGIDHAGRSAAKNIGILAAQADLVLLFDDDDVATPSLVGAHLATHREHPEPELAVLGRTTWAPELPVSPVMDFLTDVGMLLLSYGIISAGQVLDFTHFWEGRISCKRAFLMAHGLHDQRLAYTIDIELAYRLETAADLKVLYAPDALSHTARTITFADFAFRCRAKGRAARVFSQLHTSTEVRDYCHIDHAEATYPSLAAALDADLERLAELEEQAGPLRSTAPAEVLAPLNELYDRLFMTYTYQGIVEASARQPGWPVLSVVIAVWSVTEDLAAVAYRTIERLWDVTRVPTEIIVIDNGSPHPRDLRATTYLRWPNNRGVAPARNTGLAAARGEVLVVLNSDVYVEPGWDEALVEAATTGRRIAFPYTDHCDGLGSRRPDKAGTAGWCFALHRTLFAELGPFDEQFAPAYWEDTDYWHRAHLAGVDLTPVPQAHVQHARRTTARHLEGFDELFERNRRRYEHKHGMRLEEPPPYWHRTINDHKPGPKPPHG